MLKLRLRVTSARLSESRGGSTPADVPVGEYVRGFSFSLMCLKGADQESEYFLDEETLIEVLSSSSELSHFS